MSDIPLDPTSNRKSPDLSGLLSKEWLNGKAIDETNALSILDRGAQFGDGLFETILIHKGNCPLLDLHITRLTSGLETLAIKLEQGLLIADLMLALEHAMRFPEQSFRLKFRVTRGNSNTGYSSDDSLEVNRIVELRPLDHKVSELKKGVTLGLCQWPLSTQANLVRVKHLNRLDQVMAKRELVNTSHFDGLMIDNRGFVTETTMCNLFWQDHSGQWNTPIIDQAGLLGVMRQYVLERADDLGISVQESRLTLDEIKHVKALFVTNAITGIIPVIQLEVAGKLIPLGIDTITTQLMNAVTQRLGL